MSPAAKNAAAIADARPRVVSALAVHLRDLDAAEDAFSEAMEACLSLDALPDNVTAWLLTVAKRKAVDAIRRREAETRSAEGAAMVNDMAEILQLPEPIADERLRLILICCHPSLALEARAAMALKVICGLPVGAIAKVFLTSEVTMFQRITRAKAKVREAQIAFELPHRKHWPERLDAVLLTLELAYTVAYQDAGGECDPELSEEIGRLSAMVAELLPEEPEALGLAALIALARSREGARLDVDGAMIPLSQQDTAQWDHDLIEQARQWLDKAAEHAATGPYQVMAAMQLTHARRLHSDATDWPAIVKLYDALMVLRPGPMIALNRALAVAQIEGAANGMALLDALPADRLKNARPLFVAKARLLVDLGDKSAAREAFDAALALQPARAERLYLERKRKSLS